MERDVGAQHAAPGLVISISGRYMRKARQAIARIFAQATSYEAEYETERLAITFATFSYESSGFASFATKRRERKNYVL
ncbi:MAG TPA: hypothetical protein VJ417_01770 [Candidatus Glassbacteria bacterium]|nr:hypothetical protein [Candidatus Glassbacteria bacterium]